MLDGHKVERNDKVDQTESCTLAQLRARHKDAQPFKLLESFCPRKVTAKDPQYRKVELDAC